MKKEGKPQERTGHTRRSFSHDFSHGMTLNSNTPTQAKADRLPLPERWDTPAAAKTKEELQFLWL